MRVSIQFAPILGKCVTFFKGEGDRPANAEKGHQHPRPYTRNTRLRARPEGAQGRRGSPIGQGGDRKAPQACATLPRGGTAPPAQLAKRARAVARKEGGAVAGCARAGGGRARPPFAPRAVGRTYRRASGRDRKGGRARWGARADRPKGGAERQAQGARAHPKGAFIYPCAFRLRSRILRRAPLEGRVGRPPTDRRALRGGRKGQEPTKEPRALRLCSAPQRRGQEHRRRAPAKEGNKPPSPAQQHRKAPPAHASPEARRA